MKRRITPQHPDGDRTSYHSLYPASKLYTYTRLGRANVIYGGSLTEAAGDPRLQTLVGTCAHRAYSPHQYTGAESAIFPLLVQRCLGLGMFMKIKSSLAFPATRQACSDLNTTRPQRYPEPH